MKESEKSALIVEIFEATGIAVDKSDPIVICALLQSRYIKDANAKAIEALNLATAQSIVSLEKATATAVVAIENAIKSQSDIIVKNSERKLAGSIESIVATESSKIKLHLTKYSDNLKSKLGAIEIDEPTGVSQKRVAISVVGVAGAAMLIGAFCFSKPAQFTGEQKQQLLVGKEMIAIIPYLDADTRKKLKRVFADQSN